MRRFAAAAFAACIGLSGCSTNSVSQEEIDRSVVYFNTLGKYDGPGIVVCRLGIEEGEKRLAELAETEDIYDHAWFYVERRGERPLWIDSRKSEIRRTKVFGYTISSGLENTALNLLREGDSVILYLGVYGKDQKLDEHIQNKLPSADELLKDFSERDGLSHRGATLKETRIVSNILTVSCRLNQHYTQGELKKILDEAAGKTLHDRTSNLGVIERLNMYFNSLKEFGISMSITSNHTKPEELK